MLTAGGGRDQCTGQLHVAIREPHVCRRFDLSAFRGPRRRAVTLPGQRDNLTGGVALKRDARLDRGGHSGARTGEKRVAVGGIQGAHIAGLVKRHELRLAESAELVPHLQVDERVRSPLIDACVLAKGSFIDRADDGSLTCRDRDERAEKEDNRRASYHRVRSGVRTHVSILSRGSRQEQPSRFPSRVASTAARV